MFNRWIATIVLRIPGVMSQLMAVLSLTKPCTCCHEEIYALSRYCYLCGVWQKDGLESPLGTAPMPVVVASQKQPEQHTEPLKVRIYPIIPEDTALLPLIPSTHKDYFPGVDLHRHNAQRQKAGKR